MPTRFYLSSTETVSQTPEFAAWTRTTEALRRSMSPVKDDSAITSTTIWANGTAAADESALARQFVSAPMAAGIAFSTSDTIKAQVRCMESAVNDNINRSPITVKVYSEDGSTLRATLLGLGHVGLNTTEWIASTLTNKTIANGDALTANYTTVLGDILVIEMGGQVSAAGGTSVLGTMSFGSASASDLGENETDTAANNPWFEISRTISFATVVTTAPPTALAITTFAASLQFTTASTPATASLTVSTHAPVLKLSIVPAVATLSLAPLAASLNFPVTPSTGAVTTSTFTPTIDVTENVTAIPSTASLIISGLAPTIPSIVFADPGGDAVQADGYFGVAQGTGTVSFDTSQKRNGVGSWKFDSGVGNGNPHRKVAGVLPQGGGRIGGYFRYDEVPDTSSDANVFSSSQDAYSGGGFTDAVQLQAEDGVLATATPAKNSAQGSILDGFFSIFEATPDLIIDSIKIVYNRFYSTTESIGISRVRWVVGAEEGPNHDNAAMPTVEAVVEVDITADRTWTPADINSMQVIAEALRGDTDTPHTQGWDYVKVVVSYHGAVPILYGRSTGPDLPVARLDVLPTGSGLVLRYADADGVSFFDGITIIPPSEWHRIALCWIEHGTNNLEVKVFLDGIEELWLVERGTIPAFPLWPDLMYGWIGQPGAVANKVCRFDQIYIDDVDDLSDPGPRLMTNKSGATVNADNFDTTGGTGAVNERPVNLANYKQQAGVTQVHQNYTLQAANVGDVDISDETYIGYMGWAIAKKGAGTGTGAGLTANGVTTDITLTTTEALHKAGVFDANYPSNAAGIGLRSIDGDADTFLYECGAIVVYQGPPEDILFAEYLLLVNQSAEVVDDLRAAPPDSYTVRYWIREGGGMVRITGYFITAEGESPREWSITGSRPAGTGIARLDLRCIEMRIVMEVTEADTFVMMQHYLNL